MDLALTTGTGPKMLTDMESFAPYILPSDVVVFGYRLPAPKESSPATPHPPMTAYPLDRIRTEGIDQAAAAAVHTPGRHWVRVSDPCRRRCTLAGLDASGRLTRSRRNDTNGTDKVAQKGNRIEQVRRHGTDNLRSGA